MGCCFLTCQFIEFRASSVSLWNWVERGQGVCLVCVGVGVGWGVALCLNGVCVGADGEAELQWAAADQKAEKRRLQWGDGRGGPARENPKVHCGESAVCLGYSGYSAHTVLTSAAVVQRKG